MPLNSTYLKHVQGYVDGRWCGADSGATAPVTNPANGEVLANVPVMGAAEAARAVEAAARVVQNPPSLDQRRRWLEAIAARLTADKNELGRIITLEHGKPLKEGVGEVEYAAGFFEFFAKNLDALKDHKLPDVIRNCVWTVHHRPAGVAALIVPWNFPLGMLAKKLAAAIGAGCATITKPASLTPLSAIALWHAMEGLGMPPGFANLVIGKAGPIGDVLCSHPAVRIISFTGSTETGKVLIEKTAPHIKRLAMELGGNAPFIVFDDADLDAAVEALMGNKFRSAGQTCVCANRVYVHRAVSQSFLEKLRKRVAALKVGDGMAEGTDIGPLVDRAGFDKVAQHVKDALNRGAKRLVGGDPARPAQDWGAFYPPTLLTDVTPEMLACREETFGPLVPVILFENEDDVVKRANETEFGLAAYVFSKDAQRVQRIAPRLSFGHVGVNTGTGPTPQAPFGGMKQSGFGREGGVEGLIEFCEAQVVASALPA